MTIIEVSKLQRANGEIDLVESVGVVPLISMLCCFSGDNIKVFIPGLIGPLLEMTLIPETGRLSGTSTTHCALQH